MTSPALSIKSRRCPGNIYRKWNEEVGGKKGKREENTQIQVVSTLIIQSVVHEPAARKSSGSSLEMQAFSLQTAESEPTFYQIPQVKCTHMEVWEVWFRLSTKQQRPLEFPKGRKQRWSITLKSNCWAFSFLHFKGVKRTPHNFF